jgi:hypothetical protein
MASGLRLKTAHWGTDFGVSSLDKAKVYRTGAGNTWTGFDNERVDALVNFGSEVALLTVDF